MAIARLLWSETTRTGWLLGGSSILLLAFLGTGELWTHEGRWAVICLKMMQTGQYFHPYQFDEAYYDKPLLSYWIMIAFARLLGGLHEWALRLPSVLSAILSIWCTYRIGARLFDRPTGLLAGWILGTCVQFAFWSRVASADMLNVFGTIAAVAWYMERRDKPGWTSHSVFWLILATASQTKGLVAPAVAILAILPDLFREGRWKAHLRPSLFVTLLPAAAVYFAPFFISTHLDPHYAESGLWQVFRENIQRYFAAYDHQGPPYLYFIWLPVYMLPWSVLLPFAVWGAVRRWKSLSPASKWAALSTAIVFLMFTFSTSRRGYYILPALPFASLFLADWLRPREAAPARLRTAGALAIAGAVAIVAWFWVAVPLSLQYGGFRRFAEDVRATAETRAPWKEWEVMLVDISPQSGYYLRNGPLPHNINFPDREKVAAQLRRNPKTIIVTRKKLAGEVRGYLDGEPRVVELRPRMPGFAPEFIRKTQSDEDAAVAFIP